MRKYEVAILTIALVLMSQRVSAQYDAYFSHYFDMQTSFNPAAAGKEDQLNAYGAYAMTLAGFENSPKTMLLAGDMPFVAMKQIHGVGLQLMSDQIGLFAHQKLAAQYSFRKKVGSSWLSIGVQAGLLNEKWNGSKVDISDEQDEVLTKTDVDGNALDLGAGIYFRHNNWYIGASGQHLTSPTVTLGEANELKVDGTFYLHGGADFRLRNPLLKVATSAMVRTDLTAYRADVTGRVIYTYEEKMMYGGVTYSPTNSVTMLVGGQFHGVVIGYSFEMYTNGISLRNGSHELFVGYRTDLDLGKKGKNMHQTTRTL